MGGMEWDGWVGGCVETGWIGGGIGAAYVPVDDVPLVHVVEPVEDLLDDALDARRRERDPGVDQPRQVVVHVLHHQVDVAHPHADAAAAARAACVPAAIPAVAPPLLLQLLLLLRAGAAAHRGARLKGAALVVHVLD